MKKFERAKIIKSLLDELRNNIIIESNLELIRLEHLKKMENRAIEENTDDAVEKIKEYVFKEKNNIMEFPAIGVKSQQINGEFKITKL